MNNQPIVKVTMLIRKPVNMVFNAFIDPSITTQFWFTKSSGKLEEGKTIKWEWEMYGASADVIVKHLVENKLIKTEWGTPATQVDYEFETITSDKTFVTITHAGFNVNNPNLMAELMDSTSGFTTVLDGLKAYLEFGIALNLVSDKFIKE